MDNWVHPPVIDTEFFCDVSDFAWEGVFETKPTGGALPKTEKDYLMNEKGLLLAIFYTWNHLNLICKVNMSKHF